MTIVNMCEKAGNEETGGGTGAGWEGTEVGLGAAEVLAGGVAWPPRGDGAVTAAAADGVGTRCSSRRSTRSDLPATGPALMATARELG
jgi:hypothetical protein